MRRISVVRRERGPIATACCGAQAANLTFHWTGWGNRSDTSGLRGFAVFQRSCKTKTIRDAMAIPRRRGLASGSAGRRRAGRRKRAASGRQRRCGKTCCGASSRGGRGVPAMRMKHPDSLPQNRTNLRNNRRPSPTVESGAGSRTAEGCRFNLSRPVTRGAGATRGNMSQCVDVVVPPSGCASPSSFQFASHFTALPLWRRQSLENGMSGKAGGARKVPYGSHQNYRRQ